MRSCSGLIVKDFSRAFLQTHRYSRHNTSGPLSGTYRCNRGGSWNNTARNCRSAFRNNNNPSNYNNNLGFRLALVPAQRGRMTMMYRRV
ncbi:MAG: hypothetical protein EOM44_14965 [Bacteroidia bacterium]|nr:hypothetical protein [Bacteroidia bacterium]